MSEQYTNAPATTLGSGINNSVTSLTVASATGFPTSGNFRIIIDSEIMLVTAVSGTTFTITRGQETTTAASHSGGATLAHILTAGALDQIRADHINADTFANRPSASKAGNLFFSTDGHIFSRDTGSAWVNWGGLKPLGTEISTGSYSWVNQNSGTLTTTFGGVFLYAPKASGDQIRAQVLSRPSAPYTRILAVQPFLHNANFCMAGICVRDSGTGKFILYGVGANGGPVLDVSYWNSATSFSGRATNFPMPSVSIFSGVVYLKINDDNTSHIHSWSLDGSNWLTVLTVSRTTFLTAGGDQIGFFVHQNNSTWDAGALFLSFT